MNKNNEPNYKKIYSDILKINHCENVEKCETILSKPFLTFLDVIKLNEYIFGKKNETINGKHKSYNKKTILEILTYQKKHKFNNTQTAKHFKLSRNTVAKWKKMFL